jgi:pilus assembly protein CpaF
MSLAARLPVDVSPIDRIASPSTRVPALSGSSLAGYQPVLEQLRERLAGQVGTSAMPDGKLRLAVEAELGRVLATSDLVERPDDVEPIRSAVLDEVLGFGLLQDLLDDPEISEIMVNGPNHVFVESHGIVHRSPRVFESEEQLLAVISRMVRTAGRRVDHGSPMVDARLPDGSRMNVVLPPLAVDGPTVTIRKFTAHGVGAAQLVTSGSLSDDAARFLRDAVEMRLNILVSGGTGTGKTTLLNMLSSFIDPTQRVITVEDAVELTLDLPNLIRLETRPASIEGSGQITIRDLVRNALRMRPDRIVVGEVRGAEALDMLQAMNTGHAGSLSTLHANSPRDALNRLETMVLFGGIDLPLRAIRDQVASAIDLIVQVVRDGSGHRYVSSITEVVGQEGDIVTTAELFARSPRLVGDEVTPIPGRTGIEVPLTATGVPCTTLRILRTDGEA